LVEPNKLLIFNQELKTNYYIIMKTSEEIIKIIEETLADIEFNNTASRMSDVYYLRNDAKIEVLEHIQYLINKQ